MSLLGRSVELPAPRKEPVTVQFTECVELKPEIDEPMERLLDYWGPRLSNVPTLELPTDRQRPTVPSYRGEIQHFTLPPDLVAGLKDLSRRENVTLFMTLAAAFQVLLQRYSGQDDIVIGTPATSSSRLGRGSLQELPVDTLALRTDLSGNPGFRELLAQVREVTVGAYAHQDLPFDKLVEALSLPRGRSRNPLFQVMFMVRSVANDKLQVNEIAPKLLKTHTGTAQFDLILDLSETPQGWEGSLGYAAGLFEAATINRLIGHFQTLLEGIVARPEARLSELPLLTESECRQLLVEWNDTSEAISDDRCIHQLFEEQVTRTPEAVAIVHEGRHMTYDELNARANQMAHHLRSIGVGPEVLVGICLERSLDMVVALLSVLKAGGAYVPLDPAYPKERLVYMLEDSAPLALLTHSCYETLFSGMSKCPLLIDLSAEFSVWMNQPITNPNPISVGLKPENLAYVIYTSGSTGKPKGAGVLHQGLQNLLPWYIREAHLSSDDAVLVTTSMAFDLTQRVIFGPLIAGARLVLASEPFDPSAIMTVVVKERISMMNLTPSGFHMLIDSNSNGELGGLRQVFLGGEPMQPSKLLELPEPRPEFVNCYGPTECTATATFHRVPDIEQYRNRSVPIGKPIVNARIYILDTCQQPVPIGVTGEIYIGGVPVGRGYLNRLDLTEERFVPDPFAAKANARMYKTGDLARWLADGTIEYLGRNDFQVKIRGFRIELGEIEATLRQHPQIRDGAVGVYEPIPGDKRLVAYLVAHSDAAPALSELHGFFKQQLPEFMIPSAFVFLDELPLTPNGKLDRNALPMPDMNRQELDVDFIAPRSQVEKQLAEIWCDVLRINRVGIHDNFFDLGGQSLLATQIITRVSGQLSVEIPLARLFEMPTIAGLAKLIENTRASAPNDSSRIIPQRRSAYKTGIQ